MSRQLAFDLPGQDRRGRADFFPSVANARGLGMVDNWRDWPGGMLLLIGPEGAGKSHLAGIWAEQTGAAILPATELAGAGLAGTILPVTGLAGAGHPAPGQAVLAELTALAAGPLCIEDADRIAGAGPAETRLFHLHNLLREAGQPLLLTARTPPRDWGLALADLHSRLSALPLVRVEPPDDALLSAVLAKLFSDRQVAAPPSLIPWLVARMERSIPAARRLVAELDRRALARGGPITRADAAELLSAADPPDDSAAPA